MDSKQLNQLRRALLKERERILNNSKSTVQNAELALPAEDLSDETDLAAHEVHQNLAFQLRDRERRLLAVPWTRLSLVGAEMRENRGKRFA